MLQQILLKRSQKKTQLNAILTARIAVCPFAENVNPLGKFTARSSFNPVDTLVIAGFLANRFQFSKAKNWAKIKSLANKKCKIFAKNKKIISE